MKIKERNGGEFRTDLSVAQPPCTRCRHADVCDLPPQCHALRYFETTGKRITPPLLYPGEKREQAQATPAPRTAQRDDRGMTADLAEALREFERDMLQGNN